jgi:hypothetical protein
VHPALLALIEETPQRRAAREEALASCAQELKSVLETETYAVIDGLLGETMCSAMRAEAMGHNSQKYSLLRLYIINVLGY